VIQYEPRNFGLDQFYERRALFDKLALSYQNRLISNSTVVSRSVTVRIVCFHPDSETPCIDNNHLFRVSF
jgi:hypothetical protein